MRRRKLCKTFAVLLSAMLLAASSPLNLTKVSAKNKETVNQTLKSILEDPTEDGEYTLTFSAKTEGSDQDSMLTGFFDPKAKLTVKDGKMWITVLNTAMAEMMFDFTLGDGNSYGTTEKTGVGEANESGSYSMYEYKIEITKPSQITKAAGLMQPKKMIRNQQEKKHYTKLCEITEWTATMMV